MRSSHGEVHSGYPRRNAKADAAQGRLRDALAALLIASLLLACAARARAETSDDARAGELRQLSLEQLMNVEVTSVAKEPQKLLRAPAAIQVITSEDIRRSGATSLPEALRLADNLEVAQENAHDWAISARGFDANLANKLLVLIDGRAVYTPLYGGVLWNVQDYLLEDIDRIEVISGPGGTLWGANAVNGVINIITKAARNTQGVYASAAAGNRVDELASARYGGELAPDVYWRVYGKYTDLADEVTSTGVSAQDAWHMGRGGFRLDAQTGSRDAVTVQGDFYNGKEEFGANGVADLSGGNLLSRWTHTTGDGATMSLQFYYDHTHLTQPYAASPPADFYTGFPGGSLVDDLDTYDLDYQYHFGWGDRQKLAFGLGYRATRELDVDPSIVRFFPPALNQSLYNAFVQDEIRLAPNVLFTAGTKLEHNDYTGFEAEPSARLQWNLTDDQMLWSAVSRAVRTPSRYDRDLLVPSGLYGAPPPLQFPAYFLRGNPDFTSERLIAYEAGYRAALTSELSTALSAFYNVYQNLRSTTATPTSATYPFPLPVYFQNNLEGETHGIELSLTYQVLAAWRLHLGYDLLLEHIVPKPGATDATGASNETADPQQQFQLRSSANLPRDLDFDAALRWVDSLHINNSPTGGPDVGIVPSYFEFDARLAWHAAQRLEFAVVGQNLLHERHTEYGFPSTTREEIQRSIFAQVSWGY
jgi:iron complex outermembrane recepter protein